MGIRLTLQQKAELGVHGYLRESLQKMDSIEMPRDLIQLIAIWYGMIDYWDIDNMHPAFQFNSAENAVHRTAPYDGICSQGYGILNVKRGDIKVWKLQLMGIDPHMTVDDRRGRPIPIAHGGEPVFDVIG